MERDGLVEATARVIEAYQTLRADYETRLLSKKQREPFVYNKGLTGQEHEQADAHARGIIEAAMNVAMRMPR